MKHIDIQDYLDTVDETDERYIDDEHAKSCLIKDDNTEGVHIYKASKKDGEYRISNNSVCGNPVSKNDALITVKENDKNLFAFSDYQVRKYCARIGLRVCGVCMSYYYGNN